jgi:hypothetical protein
MALWKGLVPKVGRHIHSTRARTLLCQAEEEPSASALQLTHHLCTAHEWMSKSTNRCPAPVLILDADGCFRVCPLPLICALPDTLSGAHRRAEAHLQHDDRELLDCAMDTVSIGAGAYACETPASRR